MRWLSLALCLLLSSAALAVAETPAAQPPRDVVVPEGIEGLTPEEIHTEALFAALDGDLVRHERLLEVAAERGSLLAAKDLVRLHRVRGAPDWRETAMRTLRPIPRAEPIDWEQLYWLAHAGERLDPPLPQAQTDLWYRLAAWQFVNTARPPNRAHLQRVFAAFEEEQFLDEPVSERFRKLVGEALRLRRGDGSVVFGASRTVCDVPLQDAKVLCLGYLEDAARKEDPHAAYDYAVRVLLTESGEHTLATRIWAVSRLCTAARNDIEHARKQYAEFVLANTWVPRRHRLRAYILLDPLAGLSANALDLRSELEQAFTAGQLARLDDIRRGSPVPRDC
jgi:hypothetical protein